jgi:hypothetical protein
MCWSLSVRPFPYGTPLTGFLFDQTTERRKNMKYIDARFVVETVMYTCLMLSGLAGVVCLFAGSDQLVRLLV